MKVWQSGKLIEVDLTPPPKKAEEPRPCWNHKEQKFWISKSGDRKCGICHPPACEDIVDRWEE